MFKRSVITRRRLTSGGQLVTTHFLQGKGLQEIAVKRDFLGRGLVVRKRRHTKSISRSAPPKHVSKAAVMGKIASSLGQMSLRGRGVTLL